MGVFMKLAAIKNDLLSKGCRIVDLSIGSPNIPPAPYIIDAIVAAAKDGNNYVYAINDMADLLHSVSVWYQRRYQVSLDPQTEITSLFGSQDGLAHISLAIVDPGEIVLVPDPCYPIFSGGPLLAGAQLYPIPQWPENGGIIDLKEIPGEIARKAKLMIVSYPNNPLTSVAPPFFYRDLIAFAKKYDIIVLHDNTYSDLVFDGKVCGSFLAYDEARDVGVEFNSLSKAYGLAGARIGFALGNKKVIARLKTLKSNIDLGMFLPLQKAAITALTGSQNCVNEVRAAYENRRNILVDGLNSIGWKIEKPAATLYVWAKIPQKFICDEEFALELIKKTGVIVIPGSAFGTVGAGYVRMAFVQNEENLCWAIESIMKSGII
ncbi:MAG: aminotransferase class I/II-fold pyridoxal phosphate-dependent enzyme [Dehalobacterium sp.]